MEGKSLALHSIVVTEPPRDEQSRSIGHLYVSILDDSLTSYARLGEVVLVLRLDIQTTVICTFYSDSFSGRLARRRLKNS